MSGPGLVNALAGLIASHEARYALHHEPDLVRRKYALSAEELATLSALAPDGLHITAGIVRNKRAAALRMSMPRTMSVLAEFDGHRTSYSYVDETLSRDMDLVRPIGIRREFVAWLADRRETLPPGLLDLAKYEMATVDLWGDHEAAATALEKAESPAPPVELRDGDRPVLTADARVERFAVDVLDLPTDCTLAALAAAGRRPTGLLMRKVWDRPRPVSHRVGPALVDLLLRCDGRHTVAALLDRVAGAERELRDRARLALDGIARLSVLSTAEPTR